MNMRALAIHKQIATVIDELRSAEVALALVNCEEADIAEQVAIALGDVQSAIEGLRKLEQR